MDSLILSGSTLYGMTSGGGSDDAGTIFSIGTNGSNFKLLHSFTNSASDGNSPIGSSSSPAPPSTEWLLRAASRVMAPSFHRHGWKHFKLSIPLRAARATATEPILMAA